ncbi:hypothetical protein [Clostridium manihotivorum]|uniref:Uncharacterized protein n=1 Tax=Clostridium manihotivorum TaxID=2320868 RepID=A0A3R5V8A7_9CLOT|nr:hypothetical protein [Clostridium manihotivorum]QAA32461.1 hypothetical protein C1I91_12875 [Clostridium manihotivorum]
MNSNVLAFHNLCRVYIIDTLRNYRKGIDSIDKKACELYKVTKTWNCESISQLYRSYNEKNPFWSIKAEILKVILQRIENIDLNNFHDLKAIKNIVIEVSSEARIDRRFGFSGVDKAKVNIICDKEKNSFFSYFSNIYEEDLGGVPKLYYRKVLDRKRAENIKSEVEERFQRFYEAKNLDLFVSFKKEIFEEKVDIEELIRRINNKVTRIYQLDYDGIYESFIVDLCIEGFFPFDRGDLAWCTSRLDWFVRRHHEGYYLIAGKFIISKLKELWPDYYNSKSNFHLWPD